jgi:hypothetical protein
LNAAAVGEFRPGDENPTKPHPRRDEIDRTGHEQRRHQAQVAAFKGQGIDVQTAKSVADAPVTLDRAGMLATGSSVECQCVSLNCCPTTPRPAIEIHECWLRRHCTP